MKKLYTLLMAALICQLSFAQVIDIAEAKTMSDGTIVTVRGIVTNGEELGVIRYMQDNTAGIGIYDFDAMGDVERGDSVELTGMIDPFNNLMEITGVTSLSVLSTGNELPAPAVVTFSEGFAEPYEGQLVEFENITFEDMGSFSASSSNYDITNGSTTEVVRINGTSNIAGSIIPEVEVNLIGIMSQYSPSSPTEGYQLLPRDLLDISTPGNPPIISTVLSQSNLSTTGFTVSFETLNEGNTIIRYGLSPALGSQVEDAGLTLNHSADLSGLQHGTIYYVQGLSVSETNDTSVSAITSMATVSESSGWMTAYFNAPVDLSVSSGVNANFLNASFDDTLIAYMNRAQYSLDITIYNLDNTLGIVDAINDAYDRGVEVRVIADDDINASAYSAISIGSGNKKKGPPTTGTDFGLMHNKFMIIDADSPEANDPLLWTGSTNWTSGQLLSDNNNIVIIQDQSLARAYKVEFDEMWGGDFRNDKTNNTPHKFIIGGKNVELYFSPSDEVEDRIKETIQTADHDLYVAMFSYTRFGISYEIEDRVEAGVFAAAIIDDINTSNLEYTILNDAMGDQLKLHTGPNIFHHKYMIADPNCPNSDPIVLTGSSNWTSNGTARSDENILVIHDETMANIFYQEFNQRYKDHGGDVFQEMDADCFIFSGIEDEEINGATKLFPNPVNDILNIQVEENISGEFNVAIIDLLGRTVLQLNNELIELGSNYQLKVKNLEAGNYFIRLEQNGKIFAQPFIKE